MIKNKGNVQKYVLTLGLYLVAYGIMLIHHYATDSYSAIMNRESYGTLANYGLGRIGCVFVYTIASKLNFDYYKCFEMLIFFLIFVFSIATVKITQRIIDVGNITEHTNKSRLVFFGVFIMFCNVFVEEWFSFWECSFQWGFAAIFITWAILKLDIKMTLLKWMESILLVFCALCFYQAIISIYIIVGLAIIYIANNGKFTVKTLRNSILVIGAGGIGSVLNLTLIKVLQIMGYASKTSRTSGLGIVGIIGNIIKILKMIPNILIHTYGLFPKGLLLIALLTMMLLLIIGARKKKEKFIHMIYMLIVWMICLLSVFIPHYFTSSLWLAQRTIVGFWGCFGILAIMLSIVADNDKIINIGNLICCIIIIVNIVMIHLIAVENIAINRIDEEVAISIQNKILEHQEDTGDIITGICVKNDLVPMSRYSFVKYNSYDTGYKALTAEWSSVNSINFYNNTNYESREMDEKIYKDYFEDKDWNALNFQEQMVFEEETLYMMSY